MEGKAAWVAQPEAGTAPAMRLMRWLALHAPDWALKVLLWLLSAWFVAWPQREAVRASADYLQRLGAATGFAARHRHALNFAHVMLDRVRLLAAGVDGFRIDADGQELIEELHAEGRGAVLLGAHFGSFETLRAFDRTLPGLTVRYLMFAEHAAKSAGVYAEVNAEINNLIIPLERGPDAMLAVYEALDRGEFVAFLGDRMPDTGIRAQCPVQFLSGEIRVPTSPYIAAMAARVPIFLCFAPRIGHRHYAISFAPLFDGKPVPRAQRDALAGELAQRYADELAVRCRDHPYNWFNFFDIWGDGLRGADAAQRGRGADRKGAGEGGMDRLSRGDPSSRPARTADRTWTAGG
ncbi:MAG: hypothetical protein AAGF44_00690 [Pseudomonadota bacterium]